MIKSVELVNFEAHKHNFLEFDKGLNVFKGSSGAGKSSIKRGIMWVLTNRPSANQVVSWWAIDGKKRQTDETRVTITLDNGTTISRIKSDTLNGYQINDDKPLEAVGTSVPEEVSKLLNMSDVNHQIQLAAPFLISQSASYVAQYINDIVDMSEADRYQSSVEAKRRKCNADLVANTEAIKNTTEELTHFDWLEEAEKCIKRIEKIEISNAEVEKDAASIQKSITDVGYHTEKLESCDVIPEAEKAVASIKAILCNLEEQKLMKQAICDSISLIQKHQKALDEESIVEKAEKHMKRIRRIMEEQTETEESVKSIKNLMLRYAEYHAELDVTTELLDVEERAFNSVEYCPSCGSKLAGHSCTF
jgi:DNA repair protein SbcC/Rad50